MTICLAYSYSTVCPHVHSTFVSHLFSLICQHIQKLLKVLKPITGRFVMTYKFF